MGRMGLMAAAAMRDRPRKNPCPYTKLTDALRRGNRYDGANLSVARPPDRGSNGCFESDDDRPLSRSQSTWTSIFESHVGRIKS